MIDSEEALLDRILDLEEATPKAVMKLLEQSQMPIVARKTLNYFQPSLEPNNYLETTNY